MRAPDPAASAPDPAAIMEAHTTFFASRALTAGVRLNVFTQMARGSRTVSEIARATESSERGIRMLLEALASLGWIARRGDAFELNPTAAAHLVADSPDYAGAVLESDDLWNAWTALPDSVRTGEPPRRVEEKEAAEDFFPRLVSALHVVSREPARAVARALGAGDPARRGMRVLDVACGSGVWGLGFAEADPDARLAFQDFPGVLAHTRGYVERAGAADRAEYLAGDLNEVDFGRERFDVATLGNILHSEGEASSRRLLRRMFEALRPGGRCAIVEFVLDDDRSGPPRATLFALNMLVHTARGDAFTAAEMREWLREAGFARAEAVAIPFHSPLIVGTKE